MIISEKHLRKVIREIIIESDEDNQAQTSFKDVLNQVIKDNQPKSEDNRHKSKDNQPSQSGLDYLISLDKESQNDE